MQLFPNEEIITKSDDESVILTSQRIYQKNSSINSAETKSIMLEHVTSCQTEYKSNIVALVIGVVCIFGSVWMSSDGNQLTALVGIFGVLLILFYFFTRKNQIKVSSSSATIIIKTSGLSHSAIQKFVNTVESTKHKRLIVLNTK